MGHFVINFKRLLYGIITVLVFAIFISANHFKLTSENISRQQSNTIYDLLQQADFAMYEAKQKGKNNIFFATEQSSQTKNTPSTHKMEQ
ncbi:nucleotidyl cyclase domain-containing protein [Photobacterium damselae]|uniref:hypothetical protein n=1 Tax=Photobacterium damselae TaxID=38293 RepID=UPI00165DA66D|nr:hypothetical protein [Photobacterium damselae]